MAHSTRTIPIIASSVVAVLLVAGAYVVSGPSPFSINRADAESSQELLKQYALKDTDADGLRDWEEALYGTDPADPTSYAEGKSDSEAVAEGLVTPVSLAQAPINDSTVLPGIETAPTSMTDRFAREFFARYLANRGTEPPTDDQLIGFIQSAVEELSKEVGLSAAFTTADVHAAGSGPAALKTYLAGVEGAFAENTRNVEKDQLTFFKEALESNDRAAFNELAAISKAYADIGRAMIAVPVPEEAAAVHLRTANSMLAMSETVAMMATLPTDPLLALVGLSAYDRTATEMVSSFAAMNAVLVSSGIMLTEGDAGYSVQKATQVSADSIRKIEQR